MTTQRSKRLSSSSNNGEKEENLVSIPFDLVMEILPRLPAKFIARFRCVSKLYDSTIRSSNFTESFFTISSSRPKLLFTCLKDAKTFFFSSLPPNPKKSSTLTVDFHMTFPINYPCEVSRPVHGLVCGLNQESLKKRKVTVPLVCNPSTGQYLTLPKVNTKKKAVNSFFGYDPVDKQFKVLCMTQSDSKMAWFGDYQVLTLETENKKRSWRMIRCQITHQAVVLNNKSRRFEYDGICIDGVLYYLAYVWRGGGYPDIVCFDVRFETFKCIKHEQDMRKNFNPSIESTLVNYKGKLAMLQPNIDSNVYTGIQLWVLEDAEANEWSNYIYIFTPAWKTIITGTKLRLVGTTDTGEIVLSPDIITDSFYLCYYNPVSNTVTRVGIQGMEAFVSCKAYTFLDHVEDHGLALTSPYIFLDFSFSWFSNVGSCFISHGCF